MLFSQAEIEVLALCAWCKDLGKNIGAELLPPEILRCLCALGLLRASRCGLSYRVTALGYALCRRAGFSVQPEKYYRSNGPALARRLETAEVTAFFWRYGAGMPCRAETKNTRFLPSFELRRKTAANILGGTRMTGFYYAGHHTFVPYFLSPQNSGIYADVERRTFGAESLSCEKEPFVLYTGHGTPAQLLETLYRPKSTNKRDTTDSYRSAVGKFACDTALISLDEDGWRQLRILDVPEYRAKMLRCILGRNYAPAAAPPVDGKSQKTGERFIIGFDNNTVRWERALEKGGQLHLVLLKPHTDTVRAHFGGKNVTLYPVDAVDVERALGISAPLPVIANTPFVTGKGECLDVSVIREIEKVGG